MPPIVKENEIQTAGLETAQRTSSSSAPPADSSIKQQPVALEVPVSVNGARTVEGSDKREPFSEATKTVLVFGSGAVIRLSSSVAPGQLLFLTNERTKKEVVCQVVKSKNYRNVSGYVELEFTESVVGFWGMRFPSDRLGSGPRPVAPAPVSAPPASGSPVAPRPVAPSVLAPAVNVAPSAGVPTPVIPAPVIKNSELKLSELKFVTPSAPVVPIPSAPFEENSLAQKPVAPVAKLSSSLSTSFDPEAPLSRPAAPPAVQVAPAAPVSATPEFTVNATPVIPAAPPSVLFDAPRASESQASFLEPAKTPVGGLTSSVPSLLSLFESKPAAPVATAPPAPVFADPETEALKQQTARLQEQLSNMQFSGTPAAPETVSVKIPHVPAVAIQKELAESAAKILEMSSIRTPEPVASAPVEAAKPEPMKIEPVKLESAPVESSLDDDQLKIPSWLEPLARNAAAPSSTQELIEREKAKRLAEQPTVEEIAEESVVAAAEEHHIPELPVPSFLEPLPVEEVRSSGERGSKSSSKGMLYAAIAAGVLVVAGGGWWYMQQPSSGGHSGTASNVQASVASLPGASVPAQSQRNTPPQMDPPAQTNPATLTNTSSESFSPSNSPKVAPETSSAASARNAQPLANPEKGGANVKTSASIQPVAEPEKKFILGEVHLAAPKVTPNRKAQNGAEADAGIALSNDDQPASSTEALSGGLAGSNAQPAAPAVPLPVGGDVTPAKQISSVPPVYPALAKTQHVSGNVQIDALIDATGRVSTMKVVSGPTLLHQAAMDALKKWKYQPAMLDGKPTPMHLTVTIQFRLQ